MANNLNFYAEYCVTQDAEHPGTKIGELQENVYGLVPDFEYQIDLTKGDTTTGSDFKDFVEFKLTSNDYDDEAKNFESLSIIIKEQLFKEQNSGYLRYLSTGDNKIPADAAFVTNYRDKDRFNVEQDWHKINDGMERVGKQIMAVHNLGGNNADWTIDLSDNNNDLFNNFKNTNKFDDYSGTEGGIIREYNQEDTNDPYGYNIAENFISQLIQHLININDTTDDHDLTFNELGGSDTTEHTTIDLDDAKRQIKSITLYIKLETKLGISGIDTKQEDDINTSLIRIVLNKSSKDWDSTFQTELAASGAGD